MNDRQRVLNVADVVVVGRLREVDEERVAGIARSMASDQAGGQITPIEVAPADADGKYRLISGAHRLAALVRIGEPLVMAVVFEGTRDEMRLHEIDENLCRHDLTPYDQAAFLRERVRVWERVNQQRMAAGGDVKKHSAKLAERSGERFYAEVAQELGLPERTARRALARSRTIDAEAWKLLRGHPVTHNGSELDALGRLAPNLQMAIAKLLAGDRAMTFGAAKRQLGIGTQKRDPIDALARTINGLPTADLKRLVAAIRVRVAPMIHKLEAGS